MIKLLDTKSLYDKGYIELWDFSKSISSDSSIRETITKVASISYGRDKAKNVDRLYNMLIERGHESPFEFVKYVVKLSNGVVILNLRNHSKPCYCYNVLNSFDYVATFKIKVPLFVARQVMRHRTFCYMEKSKRYTKDFPDLYYRDDEKAVFDTDIDNKTIKDEYFKRLEYFKPEQARFILPMRTYTELWLQGDYKAFGYFFIERLQKETQEETRTLAFAMFDMLENNQKTFLDNVYKFLKTDYLRNKTFHEARKQKLNKISKLWEK